MKLRRMLLGAVAALALTLGFASPALAAETTSSGSVQNLANQAVSNAAVDLYYWDDGVEDWQWTDSTTTNASGGYSFTVDDQLSYAVSVYKNGYVDSDREVRFIGGEAIPPITLGQFTSSAGAVKDAANQPVHSAQIELYRFNAGDSSWDWWDSTSTSASGGYSFDLDDAHTYTVRARKSGYASVFLGGGTDVTSADTFVGGAAIPQLMLNVIQFAPVSGKVTAMGRGAYAEVQVLRWSSADSVWETWWGEDDGIDSYVETAADGSYQFRLPVGATYTVRVDGVYLGGSTTEPASPTAANSVTLSSTAARTLPTIALSGPVFSGRVTADWMKLKNVVVTAYKWLPAQFDNPAGWYPQNSASTRADGTYQLRVAAGEYLLGFYSDNLGGERFESFSTKVPTTATAPNRRLVGASSWATVNFDFAKALTAKSVLTAKAKAGKKKGTATITVGLVLPGAAKSATTATVTVKDGKKMLKQTIKVKNGQGTLKLSKLKKGSHTFKVSYAGGRGYSASTATAKVRVK